MTPSRRRLRTALWLLRIGGALALLGVGGIIRRLVVFADSTELQIAAAIWGVVLLATGIIVVVFLFKVNRILRQMARLGGSFSPNTPAASAPGGKEQEKKDA